MLERIKLILGIEDNKHDELINLYIKKYTAVVLAYCKLTTLNEALESFIEDKIVSCMEGKITPGGGGIENTGEVKSITRGDTKIEYNVADGSGVSGGSSCKGAILTDSDREYLDSFKLRSWRLM